MENLKLIITPKTKVFDLLEAYPQLESTLIRYAPAFSKLQNPLLRKTVGKIATLQQAAVVGGVKVVDLINTLRKEVGQEAASFENGAAYKTEMPAWFHPEDVVSQLDVREMINAGEQPVNQVISDLKNLKKGEIYKLISSFIPAPLIDKAKSLGMNYWVQKNDDLYFVFFKMKEE